MSSLQRLFTRDTRFGNETGDLPNGEFEAGDAAKLLLAEAKVLVIGAGGLGCEVFFFCQILPPPSVFTVAL